ncbi:hypothetical protein JQM34_0001120 [Streptococcus oralis]|nr:hypothetical protein JQM34_0001120 [Streptococcus oralis]
MGEDERIALSVLMSLLMNCNRLLKRVRGNFWDIKSENR